MTEKWLMCKLRGHFKELPTTHELKMYLKENNYEVEDFKRVYLKLENSILGRKRSKISEYTRQELQEMYDSMTACEMAKKIGVSLDALTQYLYLHEIKKTKKLTKEKLLELCSKHTDKEVAEMLGLSRNYISNTRHKFGIKKYLKETSYKKMWKDFKEYNEFVNPDLYKKMIEMECGI